MRYITGEELREFEAIRDAANKVKEAVAALSSKILESRIPKDDMLSLIEFTESRLNGVGDLPYMLTPQPEWTGGETFKVRTPHALETRP